MGNEWCRYCQSWGNVHDESKHPVRLPRCVKCGHCIRKQEWMVLRGEHDAEGRQLGKHIACPWPYNAHGLALID